MAVRRDTVQEIAHDLAKRWSVSNLKDKIRRRSVNPRTSSSVSAQNGSTENLLDESQVPADLRDEYLQWEQDSLAWREREAAAAKATGVKTLSPPNDITRQAELEERKCALLAKWNQYVAPIRDARLSGTSEGKDEGKSQRTANPVSDRVLYTFEQTDAEHLAAELDAVLDLNWTPHDMLWKRRLASSAHSQVFLGPAHLMSRLEGRTLQTPGARELQEHFLSA